MADSTDPSPAGGLRIGACQPPEIMADTEAALAWIEDFARQGADKNVDLLLFPECFLQGYLFDPDHVSRHAMDFTSPAFTAVLRRLAPIEATVVVGVIETEHGRYFNTAAVVTGGRLIGRYRKTRLMPGETIFDPGDTYPTFVQGGVRYGINICSDTQFPEPAAQVAAQGAQVLLVSLMIFCVQEVRGGVEWASGVWCGCRIRVAGARCRRTCWGFGTCRGRSRG
ncbi:carbon-nitrogen hydrolase family protein [Actinoplanes rectilineatus]|uniref:carbon-nitrogen hydrolase family protein n=1 Tax=Actinoplanes rectilineatus TaxID=113571 RepID=UPI000698C05C|nr:carbon-nitrogen hydrolase family protein [Actinoplanes rectilineatus]